jgi:fermentation-respiration switch protein FrsA (DUF1100 family)
MIVFRLESHGVNPNPSRRGPFFFVLRWIRFATTVFLLVLLMLLQFENFLIFPAPKYPAGRWQPEELKVEDAYFQADDGTKLHGWYVDHPQPIAHVLYCHGNGEHLGYLDWLLADFHRLGIAVFAFDYRGYGRSEGKPNEAGVLADGRAAKKWLEQRAGIGPNEIVLMGRSIGGAVAIDLAAETQPRALVVESTFTSIPDVAATIYWWAPVRLLMRTKFESEQKIRKYSGPLLQSHGTADSLVPFPFAERLFAACPSEKKQLFQIPGGDHNDPQPPDYYVLLVEFLQKHAVPKPLAPGDVGR